MKLATIAAVGAAAIMAAAPLAAQEPRHGGTLIVPLDGDANTLDCHQGVSSKVLHRTGLSYSLLLRVSEENYPEIEGDLAKDWEISEDGLTYTFNLHEGVTFHDGSDLTSEDVKASLDRIRTPPEGVASQRQGLFADVSSIETPDDNTVVITLGQPNVSMLTYLANPWNCIYSAEMLESDPAYPAEKVMGSGPFTFVSSQVGGTYRVERFEDYFRDGLPYLDAVEIPILGGPSFVNAFVAGQVHADFRGATPGDRDRIKSARGDDVVIHEMSSPGLQMFTFNTTRPPLDDVRVRRALTMSVDRWGGAQALKKLLFFNNVGATFRPGSYWARSDEELAELPGWSTDIEAAREEAKALLKEAGAEDLELTFTNFGPFVPFGVFLIDQWTKIGVTASQEVLAPPQFFAKRAQKDFQVLLDANQSYIDDPSLDLAVYRSSSINELNLSGLDVPEIDALYEKQEVETDPAKRREIAQEIEKLAMEQAFTNPLLWAQRIIILDSKVKGFHMSPSSLIGRDLAEIWLAEE